MANNKVIEDLLTVIDDADKSFIDGLPQIQKEAFTKVINIAKDLDVRSDGSIRTSVKNLKLISRIKQEIDKVVFTKAYQKSLFDFMETFNKIEEVQNKYFANVSSTFTQSQLFKEVKKQSVDIVAEQLGKQALSANISSEVRSILTRNITSGAKFSDLVNQMRIYLTDTEASPGALTRYAKVYTIDSLTQYSAMYDQLATDDLGLEWYQYVGSLKKTSRDFCKELIHAKDSGMPFIHRSQFDELIDGNINGKQIAISDKTDLPYGMIEGTNTTNLQINRGGWGCGHLLKPVSSALVPDGLRKKYEK